jgi:hypothetical protein
MWLIALDLYNRDNFDDTFNVGTVLSSLLRSNLVVDMQYGAGYDEFAVLT